MADPREVVLQAVRTWRKAVFDLPDDRVVLRAYGADPPPRPTKTYLVVDMSSQNTIGVPDREHTVANTRWASAEQATLRIKAVGPDASHWLSVLPLCMHLFESDSVTINEPLSGVFEMSDRHGATFEYSATRDFLVSYKLTAVTAAEPNAASITINTTEA